VPALLGKEDVRREVWKWMEKEDVARFPTPVQHRIPNFKGAEKAAEKLTDQPEFEVAHVVKVNPDSPQTHVRRGVLSHGKVLIMPSPRLRKGFLILDPSRIPARSYGKASTIKGSFRLGRPCPLQKLPHVDLIVAGSVAVTEDGVRIGKGGGYSEIEYGILRELNLVSEETPIFTTVHDIQIVEKAPPREVHDFLLDVIITPTRVIRTERKHPQPKGIIWENISRERIDNMLVLKELKEYADKVSK